MRTDGAQSGRITIRFSLAALIGLSVVLTAVLTLALIFSAAQDAARLLCLRTMHDLNGNLRAQTSLHLKRAEEALEIVANLHAAGELDAADQRLLDRFLRSLMERHLQFDDLFIARPDGRLDGLVRMPDGSISRRTVRNIGDRSRTEWRHDVSTWSETFPSTNLAAGTGYDPRTRPWYKAAIERRGMAWSEVYFFSTSRRPGITCSLPLYGRDTATPEAVIGVNISLDEISRFLDRPYRERIAVVILDSKNRIVAMPLAEGERLPVSADGDLVRLDEIELRGWRGMMAAFATARPLPGHDADDIFIGEFEAPVHTNYLGMRYSLAGETPWDWTVWIMVPARLFVERIHDRIVLSVIISLLLIAVALALSLVLARRIARPMNRLAADMARVEHFDLEGDLDVASRIIEIDEISRSFVRMKTGLRSFRKYVPADLVRNLVRLGEEAELGGERRELTIYFSDIAGFTSISEKMDPEELVRHLSVYFSDLGRIFLENRATIDKYIGDAIMAFWNAPERVENHAELACRTALRVQARLTELNARWRAEGRPELGTRCGLATGEVIVGNMGSEDRLNYTVIGDTANLASRLEGLNKYYGTRIMIAESTLKKVEGLFRTRKLDIVAVKGKSLPVAIHELVAEAGPLPEKDETFIAAYESALALHVERRWQDAIARLDEALRLRPDDLAARNLRARCEDYRLAPPPKDWNGSHVMESK
jgi:adenylate cyclase